MKRGMLLLLACASLAQPRAQEALPPPAPGITSTSTVGGATTKAALDRKMGDRLEAPGLPPAKKAKVGGALGRTLDAPKPWQMLNPLAPASYGDGTEFLSTDPVTGRASGVSLISFPLPSKAPKAAKNRGAGK